MKCSSPTVCTECMFLSLQPDGSCRRCADPRCGDCSGGDPNVCKACRSADLQLSPATGRCVPKAGAPARAAVAAAPAPAGEAAAGRSAAPAIVGGQAAQRGRYPWLASLRMVANDTTGETWGYCGGSLVHERVVMTAGGWVGLVCGSGSWLGPRPLLQAQAGKAGGRSPTPPRPCQPGNLVPPPTPTALAAARTPPTPPPAHCLIDEFTDNWREDEGLTFPRVRGRAGWWVGQTGAAGRRARRRGWDRWRQAPRGAALAGAHALG